ncbi:hypothetical protein F4604DRAFT_1879514 [Suillus subluteus]|nr:hypothetical protein F4604DRAFT_1879514 [Suillus subluteus]
MMNMVMTQYAVCDISGKTPSCEQNIQGFLWKSLHGAYKIGEFWDKIPHYEERGKCGLCSSPESMEHILLECESPASCTIWQAANDLWCKREPNWPEVQFGTILGCNLAIFTDDKGKIKSGSSRLFKIIVQESAHLIWKLRCKRTIKFEGIKEKFHSKTEIYNRWVHAINIRLKFNHLLTNSMRYRKKALKVETVLKTWSGILLNEENLLDNWVHKSGVLVGMVPHHPLGRNR